MKYILIILIFIFFKTCYPMPETRTEDSMDNSRLCMYMVGVRVPAQAQYTLWLSDYTNGVIYVEPEDYSWGKKKYFISNDLGNSWTFYSGEIPDSSSNTQSPVNLSDGEKLLDVKYNSNGIGWLVTKYEDDSSSVVYIKKTIDNGSSWIVQKKISSALKAKIKIQSDTLVTIFLAPKTIIVSNDGGTNWTENTLDRGNYYSLMDLFDSGFGYITVIEKEVSILYKTSDSGFNWKKSLEIKGTGSDVYYRKNILVINDKTIFYTQDKKLYRSTDSSETWNELDNSF
ncbi:MAG: hypothetical protein KDK36_06780, partial [Leptospiraceae bacterium]|nr:hypothetical protein [Leptospiraceae bacterium]